MALSLSGYHASLPTKETSIRKVHSRLRAILPEDLDTEISATTQLIPAADLATAMPYINLVVYLLSNNLLQNEERDKTIRLLGQQKYLRLLHRLLAIKGPTTEALIENVFIDAVFAQDGNILQVALKAGANPNKTTTRFTGSALSYLARKDNLPLVMLLLDAGADINGPSAEKRGRTVLQAACDRGESPAYPTST